MALTSCASLFQPAPDGLRVFIRAKPNAAANQVDGIVLARGATLALKVSVTAAPEKGKANAALVRLLAKEWGVAKSQFEILSGDTARHKILLVRGSTDILWPRLSDWCHRKGLK